MREISLRLPLHVHEGCCPLAILNLYFGNFDAVMEFRTQVFLLPVVASKLSSSLRRLGKLRDALVQLFHLLQFGIRVVVIAGLAAEFDLTISSFSDQVALARIEALEGHKGLWPGDLGQALRIVEAG